MSDRAEREPRPIVLITDANFGDHRIEAEILEPSFELRIAPEPTLQGLLTAAASTVALMVQWMTIDEQVFDALSNLRLVVRYGSGVDNVDVRAAALRGVRVLSVPDYCVDEVSDHAVAAIAGARRRLPLYDASIKRGEWSLAAAPTPRISDRDPVGVAGYGRIGRAVARKVAASGHPVFAWDPFTPEEIRRDGFHLVDTLDALAEAVQHLSLHLPLTHETSRIVDQDVLRQLGTDGHLVNYARGGLVDEAAVLAWLDENPFATASVDVFETEPPSGTSRALALHERVTASPHVAYLSTDSLPRLRRGVAQRVLDELART